MHTTSKNFSVLYVLRKHRQHINNTTTQPTLLFLANSEVSDGTLPKFQPIQAFMADLVTCKNEEDPLENEGTRVVTTFLLL